MLGGVGFAATILASDPLASGGFNDRLAFHLTSNQSLAADALVRAERAMRHSGRRLDQIIAELGLMQERDLARTLAAFLGLSFTELTAFPQDVLLPEYIHASFVKGTSVLPLSVVDKTILLGVVDPLDPEPAQAIAYSTGFSVQISVITRTDFVKAFTALYEDSATEKASPDAFDADSSDADLQRLRDNASEAPVVRFVNDVVKKAIEARASDIHLEPSETGLQVRFRIDGDLRNVDEIGANLRAAVTSRIKIMAQLDIAERRLPQDGRLRITARGSDIDFRVSTVPTTRGESVVMRVLDRSRVNLDFESLGFEPDDIGMIRALLKQPNGIILVTGPTGSGKTTTLYAALKELNQERVKIFTVEDPVEYQLRGICQIPIQPAIGLDFPRVLRSILRQDPDIIMIGEIRDSETARIAVQAALTGHLVLTTLHTNNAASAIARLLDMGIEAFLLASTVRGVLAQRLVRRTCTACGGVPSMFRTTFKAASRFNAAACETCGDTGFSGRCAVAEILTMDTALQKKVLARGSDTEIEDAARAAGMRTMFESGMQKVDAGFVKREEVLRVIAAA